MAPASETAPSFTSLMTGRLPVSHGVRSNYEPIDPGTWTLARILHEAGYETAAFVSSFVLTADNSRLDLGFDSFDETFDTVELNRQDRPMRLAPALAGAVEGWLKRRSEAGPPWFLWVHAIDPHGPYTPIEEFRGAFRQGGVQTLSRDAIPEYQWLGTLNYFDYADGYDAEILQTDTYLGPIIEKIQALPSPRGLIVIFLADHGEALGEHGKYFQHGRSLHVEEIRVPLIIKDTESLRSGRIAAPVSLVDVAPTLLSRLKITVDAPLDGIPLDARVAGQVAVVGGYKPGEVMAVQGTRKIMLSFRDRQEPLVELYDIGSDPRERSPLPAGTAAPADLLEAAFRSLSTDPLTAASQKALRHEQWENLDSEAIEKLRSLGYIGP